MGKLQITPLLQAQLTDEMGVIRRCLDMGLALEAFNALETLITMLNEEDGDKLLVKSGDEYTSTITKIFKVEEINNLISAEPSCWS